MGLASRVGRAELNRGWRAIMDDVEAVKKVTNDDVKRVAAQYFVKDNSLTAVYKRMMGR
jgi:predicted Zn-dependent peptidase